MHFETQNIVLPECFFRDEGKGVSDMGGVITATKWFVLHKILYAHSVDP